MYGASSSSVCVWCQAGAYSSAAGIASSANCVLCSSGAYSTGSGAFNSNTCALCQVGTYGSGSGMSNSISCALCQAGSYSSAVGSVSSANCGACPAGSYSTIQGSPASANCALCPAGSYSTLPGISTSATCTPCQAGAYSTGSGIPSAACSLCASGSYTTGLGFVSCTFCAGGTYETSVGMTSVIQCLACIAGTYSNSSTAQCLNCPIGTYNTGTGMQSAGVCQACAAGTFSAVSGVSACTACAAGMYASGIGASACTLCQTGSYSSGTAVSSLCVLCQAGTYGTGVGVSSSVSCTMCQAGSFSSMVGSSNMTNCAVCVAGQYSSGSGASVCNACVPGTYGYGPGLSSCSVCQAAVNFASTLSATACVPCTICSSTQYVSAACNTTANTACTTLSGLTFVADYGNHQIRKLSLTDGSVITAAGNTSLGSVDGPGVNAMLGSPNSLSFSMDGSMLYFSDWTLCCIKSMTTRDGIYTVTTIAGVCGACSFADGVGSAVRFLQGVYVVYSTVNPSMLYISDSVKLRTMNLTTSKVTTIGGYGSVLCFNGTIPLKTAPIGPSAMYESPSGRFLLLTSHTSSVIYYVSVPAQTVTIIAGQCGMAGYSDGVGTNAQFSNPRSIHVAPNDESYFLIGEFGNSDIRKMTFPGLSVTTVAGKGRVSTYVSGITPPASLAAVNGFTASMDGSSLYLTQNNYIVLLSQLNATAYTSSIFSGSTPLGSVDGSASAARFNSPYDICAYYIPVNCSAGQYGRYACQPCPAGTYSTASGAFLMPAAVCLPCANGTFSAANGSSTCTLCSAGTYSSNSLNCTACAPGTYATASGASSSAICTLCSAGTYSTALGASSNCVVYPAPINQYVVPVNFSVPACNQYYCGRTIQPATVPCAAVGCAGNCHSPSALYDNDTTTNWDQGNLANCPGGAVGVDYDYGMVVSLQLFNTTFSSLYESTLDSSWYLVRATNTTGSNYVNVSNFSFPPFQNPKQAYFVGSILSARYWGWWVSGITVKFYIAETNFAYLFCPYGFYMLNYSACAACPAGTYGTANSVGINSSAVCQSCMPGSFSSAPAFTSCALCSPGSYAPGTGPISSCALCAVGSYATSSGSTACTACAGGTYETSLGMTSVTQCLACVAGTYSTSDTAPCVSCSVGTFGTATGAQSSAACQGCAIGTYAAIPGASACSACSSGTYASGPGLSSCMSCTVCSPGTFTNAFCTPSVDAICAACTARVNFASSSNATACSPCSTCAAGQYIVAFCTASSDVICATCPAGSFCQSAAVVVPCV